MFRYPMYRKQIQLVHHHYGCPMFVHHSLSDIRNIMALEFAECNIDLIVCAIYISRFPTAHMCHAILYFDPCICLATTNTRTLK